MNIQLHLRWIWMHRNLTSILPPAIPIPRRFKHRKSRVATRLLLLLVGVKALGRPIPTCHPAGEGINAARNGRIRMVRCRQRIR